ncbi:MAG: response regulator transcription factor [Lachnospiraceae bacterium]|nr:response regulator transcription factor [Lachnospiraceae bacterium]
MEREYETLFQRKGDKLQIAICDDKEMIVKELYKQLHHLMRKSSIEFKILPFISPIRLLECPESIHILFLDIDMPQMNGLLAAKKASEKWNDIKIIFLTAHIEYVQSAFKVKTFRYLLKPFKMEDIREALYEAMDVLLERNFKLIKVQDKVIQINIPEIYYIEALGDQSAAFRENDYIISNVTLKEWCADNYPDLYRCNKNYIVNFLHVDKIKDKVFLTNGKELPVAVRKRRQIKEAYYSYREERARILWE